MLKPGGFFLSGVAVVIFDKPPLSIDDQADLLFRRGLRCDDPRRLKRYLLHIGYYRLSAYFIPFRDPSAADPEIFRQDTTFDDVLRLYIFDRKLRLLVMEAIERIEVSLRSVWSNTLSTSFGAHGYMQADLFSCPFEHSKDIAQVARDVKGSSEVFIKHYRNKYRSPHLPPLWAVVETMTWGQLSRWYCQMKDCPEKREVARQFGMPNSHCLEGVLQALGYVRNICAHHGRLWNRLCVKQIPYIKRYADQMIMQPTDGSPGTQNQPARDIYNYLIFLNILLTQISPHSTWKQRLTAHISNALPWQQRSMGFPEHWRTRLPWATP